MATASFIPSDTTPAAIEFALLQPWLASSSALQLPLHQIETQQQAKGREVQRLLLHAQLQQRGNGDVGIALCLQHQDGEVLYSHRRLGARSLPTVFGTVELVRMGYSRPGAPSIFPLDQALALPARSFSYELQRRLVKAAVQNPFLESVQTMADLTGVSVSQRSLEEILPERALQIQVDRTLHVTLILDLIHALEKLWKAAYVFHAEGSLEADLWVLDRTLRILLGDVGQVVKGIRQSITKRALAGAQRKTLECVADSLSPTGARLRKNKSLARGWPTPSGRSK